MKLDWHPQIEPIPALQWLVVIVLSVHILNGSQTVFDLQTAHLFILSLLAGNAFLLHLLPKLIQLESVAAILVIADTLLVPTALVISGTNRTDVFVVYFGIIMIAASAKDVMQSMVLTAITCCAYLAFTAYFTDESVPLDVSLMRIPFFLVIGLFYGALGQYANRVRREKDTLAYVAMHDDLTGLPNRRFIMETLARQLEEARRFRSSLSCAILDVDHFKRINDNYGHDVGDLVLKHYAALLGAQSRGYDVAGRLGGDEFIWILPRAGMEEVLQASERFREAVEQSPVPSATSTIQLTTSVGVTTYIPGNEGHPSPSAAQGRRHGLVRGEESGPQPRALPPDGGRSRAHHAPGRSQHGRGPNQHFLKQQLKIVLDGSPFRANRT